MDSRTRDESGDEMTRVDLFWIIIVLGALWWRAYYIESDIKKLRQKVEELEKQIGGKS